MKIYIDTTQVSELLLKVDGDEYRYPAKRDASQQLLMLILEKLREKGKDLWAISSIEVAPGPGSFTGLRVGASVAQTLGWASQSPVNGKKIEDQKYVRLNYPAQIHLNESNTSSD